MKLSHFMKKALFACTLFSVSLMGAVSSVHGATATVQPEMQDTSILGATPPMGYSTWNAVRFNVNEELIRNVADSMVSNGLRDLGYKYVNIDDGWQGTRDANGKLNADLTKFPSGMKSLADYVHSKGLKIGIYTDIGKIGCGGKTGSYGHYQQDVDQFAEWGYDYVKVDACGGDAMGLDFKTQYQQFKDALNQANPKRDILLNICEWGKQQPWKWAPSIGHTWRVGFDIDNQGDYWKGVLYEIDQTSPHADVAGPGHFNDPDSLEVGVIADKYPGQKSLSYEESKANFSMWAVLASPLMLGLDVTTLDEPDSYSSKFADIIKNAEVIAVDQDPAGIQGTKVDESVTGLQVYSKPLGSKTSGERAIVLLNRMDVPAEMTVTADQIGLLNTFTVRDLWKKENKGTYINSYSDIVPAHGSVMLKVSGTYNPDYVADKSFMPYEAEASGNLLSGKANLRAVSGASGGYVVGNVGNGIANSIQFNNITTKTAGSYKVNINYVTGDASRDAELYINGILDSTLSFTSSGGWNTVGTKTVTVSLNEGVNTLKLSNSKTGAYAPDFDKIEVAVEPVPFEIASGKPASADSEEISKGNIAVNGNDANSSTRWTANDGAPNHWWKVDLGSIQPLKGTEVTWEHNNIYKYKIEVSNDSLTWHTVVDQTANAISKQTNKDNFTANGRYVRITITGLAANEWASFYDFKVYGIPKADVKTSSITVSGENGKAFINQVNGTLQMTATVQPDNASNKTVTWSVKDDNEAVTDAATIDAAGLLTAHRDGVVNVVASANDSSGVKGESKVTIDTTAPVTTATAAPAKPDGTNGWYVHPVSLNLSTADNVSGVAKTEYSLDGEGTWQNYTSPVTFSQNGEYTVSYRSTDIAGNVETPKIIRFNLDASAPTITVTGFVYGTFSDAENIVPGITLNDDLSGVDSSKTTMTLDSNAVPQGITIPLYTLPLGSHTLIVSARDLAGNASSQTVVFQTTASVESLKALVTYFSNDGWIDNAGIANSLQHKLATNNLAGFTSEVKAQSGKHISSQASSYLLRDAQYLLSQN
jgi:hypothetical protein